MMVAAIGIVTYVILFQSGFWFSPLNELGMRGWDLVEGFFRNLTRSETWGTTSGHFMIYGLVIFCLMMVFTIVSLALTLILNFGLLSRSKRLYRNAGWIMSAVMIVYGFQIWMLIEALNEAGASFNIEMFAWWFYVPFGVALIVSILGGALRVSETVGNRGRR